MNEHASHIEYGILRIEAGVASNAMPVNWARTYQHFGKTIHVLAGGLVVATDSITAQVMVTARTVYAEEHDPAGVREYLDKFGTEAMYDLARRALKNQAALLDRDIDIPTKAPESVLKDVGDLNGKSDSASS